MTAVLCRVAPTPTNWIISSRHTTMCHIASTIRLNNKQLHHQECEYIKSKKKMTQTQLTVRNQPPGQKCCSLAKQDCTLTAQLIHAIPRHVEAVGLKSYKRASLMIATSSHALHRTAKCLFLAS